MISTKNVILSTSLMLMTSAAWALPARPQPLVKGRISGSIATGAQRIKGGNRVRLSLRTNIRSQSKQTTAYANVNQEVYLGQSLSAGSIVDHFYKADSRGRVTRRFFVKADNSEMINSQLMPNVEIKAHSNMGAYVDIRGTFRNSQGYTFRAKEIKGAKVDAKHRALVLKRQNGTRTLQNLWAPYFNEHGKVNAKGTQGFHVRVKAKGESIVDLGRLGYERVQLHFTNGDLQGMSHIRESQQLEGSQ